MAKFHLSSQRDFLLESWKFLKSCVSRLIRGYRWNDKVESFVASKCLSRYYRVTKNVTGTIRWYRCPATLKIPEQFNLLICVRARAIPSRFHVVLDVIVATPTRKRARKLCTFPSVASRFVTLKCKSMTEKRGGGRERKTKLIKQNNRIASDATSSQIIVS